MGREGTYVLGVDLGGSKVRLAAVTASGHIAAVYQMATEAEAGPDGVLDQIGDGLELLLSEASVPLEQVAGVGVVSPGPIDSARGVVVFAPNLPGWRNVEVCKQLSRQTGLPATLENDASAAALAEAMFGAGREHRHLVHFTLGTGIGGGIVVDRKLYTGATGGAAELGHMTIDPDGPLCNCGNYGCLEVLSGGWALEQRASQVAGTRLGGLLAEFASAGRRLDARAVQEAADAGDAVAMELVERAGRYLGIGIASVINMLDPEVVTYSGGLRKLGPLYLDTARAEIARRAFTTPPLRETELNDDTGVLGAAAVALAAYT